MAAAVAGGVPATVIAIVSGLPMAWIGAVMMTGLAVIVVRDLAQRQVRRLGDSTGAISMVALLSFALSFLYAAVISALAG